MTKTDQCSFYEDTSKLIPGLSKVHDQINDIHVRGALNVKAKVSGVFLALCLWDKDVKRHGFIVYIYAENLNDVRCLNCHWKFGAKSLQL